MVQKGRSTRKKIYTFHTSGTKKLLCTNRIAQAQEAAYATKKSLMLKMFMNRQLDVLRKCSRVLLALMVLLPPLLAQPVQAGSCPAGLGPDSDIRTATESTVWHVGADGAIRYYPHARVFLSRHANFSRVVTVSDACLNTFSQPDERPHGVTFPPGSLVKTPIAPRVYMVSEEHTLRPIPDEATAEALWGADWARRVYDVDVHFWPDYRIDERFVDEDTIPPGGSVGNGTLSAIWANDGGEKIIQSELRGSLLPAATQNSVWDGSTVSLFGAKNEVVSANFVLEARTAPVRNVDVVFSELVGPGGARITSKRATGDALFDWTERNIELFYVRYLEIKGLSAFCCNVYDERHIPEDFRRPFDPANGFGSGTWQDRPHRNAFYPEIAVPLELEAPFDIAQGTNQSIWIDVYIPKDVPAGSYTGTILVSESGQVVTRVPVVIDVKNFTLPDEPESKTMLAIGSGDINNRFLGERYPYDPDKLARSEQIIDRYFQMAHRHKVTVVDDDRHPTEDRPNDPWIKRLDGSLYTAARGYAGPGAGVGENLYVVGLYGSWPWMNQGELAMHAHTNAWESWFVNNFPNVDRFLYLIDESHDYAQTNTWAKWINRNPGIGRHLKSMATIPILDAKASTPELDIVASTMYVGAERETEQAVNVWRGKSDKQMILYNGGRPGQGSFMIEDDGIALRELPWGQYKKGIDRWFYWSGTYYNNYQAGEGETDLFRQAHTFGSHTGVDSVKGETGWNYSNGDGVLLYPGTDTIFPASSYTVAGPIASLRLKQWRRGIQDVDYLALAMEKDPDRTRAILNRTVPQVLWEYGVDDPADPSWKRTDISWSTDPDDWEAARRELAEIIEE